MQTLLTYEINLSHQKHMCLNVTIFFIDKYKSKYKETSQTRDTSES